MRLVGVGNSGAQICDLIAGFRTPRISVDTIEYCREREKRRLSVGEVPKIKAPILVDDVAVSGLTLGIVARRTELYNGSASAIVGLAMKSKRAKREVGLRERFRPLITYSLEGGGSPPINSISSLLQYPDRLEELVRKYFPTDETNFTQILRRT